MHVDQSVATLKGRLSVKAWVAVTLSTALALSCSPSTPSDPGQTQGSIQVSVSTSGTGVPANYTVRLDGGSAQSIDVDGTVTINSLSPGNYEVELGVPTNCSVSGSTTRTVGVQEGSTSSVSYSVTCSAIPTGAIGVTTSTTGSPADPDGYTVSVDGGAGQSIGVNGTLLLADLGLGDHQVELGGVADNCLVQGANPRTVSVSEGLTTQTEFEVVCSATTGLIDVTVTTTGQGQDPDGYSVNLDDIASQPVAPSGTVSFQGVEEGEHMLTLEDVASNCTVTSENPVTADVVAGQTSDASFSVECEATTGAIEVTVSTSGEALDPDGYTVVLDGGAQSQPISVDGTVTFSSLEPGSYGLELGNVEGNCTVTSTNPTTANVSAGATTDAAFSVACEKLTGSIQVNTSTSGSNLDTNGYTVSVDGGGGESIGINGSRTFSDVVVGDRSVLISGVADNCGVQGANPRTVTVSEDATAQVDFEIVCSATAGQIEVTVSTTGEDLDPDGYSVSLDGTSLRAVATNGSTTFTGVSTGSHQLTLQNIADNCTVTSANPTSTTVVAGVTSDVSFTVECEGLTGDLRVTTDTDGEELDPNGYQVVIDGGAGQSIGINASRLFSDLDDGSHTVELEGVASNCTVDGPNPRNVTVPVDNEVNTTFEVTCDPTVGSIQVNVSTSGEDEDPNGYTVTLDGGSARSVDIDDSTTYSDLDPGSYQVALTDVADNCTVSGSNPRGANVTAGTTTTVNFAVTCEGLTGSLEVTTETDGPEPDPDGYQVEVDGGAVTRSIGADDTEVIAGLAAGSHSVELTGVADNCTVTGDNPRNVNVPADGTGTTTFQVTCESTTGSIQVGVSTSGTDLDPDGYTVTRDGGDGRSVAINDSFTYSNLAPDTYDIALNDVESNCAVAEPNPQEISVTAGNTSNATFTVTCEELTGDLLVATSTTGEDLDSDGYTILLTGGPSASADPIDTVPFPDLSPGSWIVALDETTVAGNCAVTSPNPATVSVVAGEVSDTTFSVVCEALTGDLQIMASTSGEELDPDGYEVVIDDGAPLALTINGTRIEEDLTPGDHTVELTDVATNCSVSGDNPQTVTVPAGDTGFATFDVTCDPTTGFIEVTTASTGPPDTDGYLVSLDGGAEVLVDDMNPVVFDDVSPGIHDVLLTDMDGLCSTNSDNPAMPEVFAGDTTAVEYAVVCT